MWMVFVLNKRWRSAFPDMLNGCIRERGHIVEKKLRGSKAKHDWAHITQRLRDKRMISTRNRLYGDPVLTTQREKRSKCSPTVWGLYPANVGNRPTFQQGISSSVIDVTFVGQGPFEVTD